VILGVDCVLLRGGEATGDGAALGWFGRRRIFRFSAVFGRRRVSEGAPERGKRFRRGKRGAGSPTVTNSSGDTRRGCGAPTCNLRSLAAIFGEGAEGEGRGDRGLFIGVGESLKQQGVNAY
jgi:hypothetical protein